MVCEIMQEQRSSLYFQATSLLALQEAVEAYVVSLFKDKNLCDVQANGWWRIQGDMVKYL